MEVALERPKGIFIPCADKKAVYNFRMRCYQFRNRIRDRSTRIYQQGEPGFNASEFDNLSFFEHTLGAQIGVLILASENIEVNIWDPETGEKIDLDAELEKLDIDFDK